MTIFRFTVLNLLLLIALGASAQSPQQPSSSEIFNSIRKLNVLGNVLYLAAHPDDENTRFIAWCANEKLFNAHYLSLTRGDGGQNLIGAELREELGIIRTQELLAARRVDGGSQSFSCANDFGYSRTAEETLTIWNRNKVLADVVWTIRKMRPDVIVCRFPTDARAGHGHHSASAILSLEAFALAADPKAFPEQLEHVQPWQATRIVTNTGRWWNSEINANDPGVVAEDVGTFSPVLGTSATEMAALSRSRHRSQGFGTTGSRGKQMEYFEHVKGDTARESLFDGIGTEWTRVEGGLAISRLCQKLESTFNLMAPHESIPALMELRQAINNLEDGFWKEVKTQEVGRLLASCSGLYLEATADVHSSAPGDSVKVTLEAVNRCPYAVTLKSIRSSELNIHDNDSKELLFNYKRDVKLSTSIPVSAPFSQPFWLKKEGTMGTYSVDDITLTHLPENRAAYILDVVIDFDGQAISYQVPVTYKWNDPVTGENHRPFVITPPVLVSFADGLEIFTSDEAREVEVKLLANTAGLQGELHLSAPKGWTLDPDRMTVKLSRKDEEQRVKVRLMPSKHAENGALQASLHANGQVYDLGMRTIAYEHIPTQTHFPKAQCQVVRIDLKRQGERIGYLPGAGDAVPEALRAIGYTVDELTEADLDPIALSKYDAILTGIRFLNVNDRAPQMMPALLKYAGAGGTVILQYNTSRGLETDAMVPFPLTLGRERVTEEDAKVTLLLPDHPALTSPNRITEADFDGWVQERGLYFASVWDAAYTAPLRMNDTGQKPEDGSLLIAKHGKGHFVYTGISFFRQLPAGVPGAYRLLANLIALDGEGESE
ncbi:MAG: PIG-L family deacetylase [Flavobacteriales bacterium]|nr:PIG-L family deacetylase [Flavobacteriales bacterium]